MPERRLKVLVGAYACGPGDESEASAGWAFVRAAARHHDVWLVTRRRFASSIAAASAADPEVAQALRVTYLDLSSRVLAMKRRPRDVYWYYMLWQRALRRLARRMNQQIGFDVAHHVTFAADWLPSGLTGVEDLPLVWGPVGGATYTPRGLLRTMGWRNAAGELVREAITRSLRRIWGDRAARRASVVVAQNHDVARRFAGRPRVVVEPNAAFDALPTPIRAADPGRRAIFVARLLAWKGCHLAIAALAEPAARGWTLDVFGSGREQSALVALAERLGVGDRVEFHGQRPRAEVLAALASADALLFPSLHDSAGWAVGEASASGCPVVCLDVGGPPILAGPNGVAVPATKGAVADLARGLEACRTRPRVRYDRWSADRLPATVADWYAFAVRPPAAVDIAS